MNKKEFEEIYNEAGHGPGSHFDRLWSRIAPLMRGEFPEEGKPKGICPKCRGSGRVPRKPPQYISAKFHDNPCPDCKGTGECQHVGIPAWPADGPPLILYPRQCPYCREILERRSGEERRKSEGHRNYDRTAGMLIKDVGTFWVSRRRVPDRRKC